MKSAVTTRLEKFVTLNLEINEVWALYNQCRNVGGPIIGSVRTITDTMERALEDALVSYYNVSVEKIRTLIFNRGDDFGIDSELRYREIDINAVVKGLEESLNK